MKLAIKQENLVNNETDLKAINVSNISNLHFVFNISNNNSYMYFENALNGDIKPNSGVGYWLLDKSIKPIYSVSNDYDFQENSAIELDLITYLNSDKCRLGNYELTYNDYNEIANKTSWKYLMQFINKPENFDVLSPNIISLESSILLPETSTTIKIICENIDFDTLVYIPNFDGTIDDVRILSSSLIEVDITTGVNINTYDIILANGYKKSDNWLINEGLEKLKVKVSLPTGPEKNIRIDTASGDNYVGVTFAKNSFNFETNSDRAFDGNNGTRHYSLENQSQDHFVGIILTQPTLLTEIKYDGDFGSDEFRLEGSNNTTNGLDGNWDDLGDWVLGKKPQKIKSYEFVYLAFRIVWISPTDSEFANAKEIKFKGKQ